MSAWVEWKPPTSRKRRGAHKMTGAFGKKSRISYRYCTQCGLLNLRNDVTRRAMRRQCVWEDE